MVRYMYLDAAALSVLILMLIANIAQNIHNLKRGRIFISIIITCVLTAIFEILTTYPSFLGINALWIFTTLYFVFRAITPLLYLIYILQIINPEIEKKKEKKMIITLSSLYVIMLILLVINPFLSGEFSVFYFDGITYNRGYLIYVLFGISAIYLMLVLLCIFKYRKFFDYNEIIVLVAICPLNVIAIIIQSINMKLLVEIFSTTLALLLIQIVMERKEILSENITGLRSKKVFVDLLKRSFTFKHEKHILLINIFNYNELNNLSTEEAINYTKELSILLDKNYRDINPNYKTFYLDTGLFSIIVDNEMDSIQIANNIIIDSNKFMSGLHINSSICIINNLNDFDSFDSLFLFVTGYKSKIKFNENVTLIKDVKDNKDFIIMNNIDSIIDTAIKEDEFQVYFQPIINIKENKFKTAEALVRLISKKYGFISPGAFIPYSEKNGRIFEIDNIVMEKVFQFISSPKFKELGLEYIEINLSMVDCMDKTLSYRIISLMKKYNIDPKNINLEITESQDSINNEIAKENINRLVKHGIKFSLDDYGTGYSNMERFSNFPIKIVKIDKSLVDLSNEEDMKTVLKATFKLIQELNKETVVEGIETESQAKLFKEFGCDYIQGYYYSRPLPQSDFIEFIIKNKNE